MSILRCKLFSAFRKISGQKGDAAITGLLAIVVAVLVVTIIVPVINSITRSSDRDTCIDTLRGQGYWVLAGGTYCVPGTLSPCTDNTYNLGSVTQSWKDAHIEGTVYSSIGRSATNIIAANDSSAKSKAQADYICDGTADNVEIQAALDALPLLGGEVKLLEGTYYIAAEINTSKTSVTLSGCGKSTKLKLSSNINRMIYLGGSYQTVKDILFDGSGKTVTGSHLVRFDGGSYNQISNCMFYNTRISDTTLSMSGNYWQISNLIFRECYSSSNSSAFIATGGNDWCINNISGYLVGNMAISGNRGVINNVTMELYDGGADNEHGGFILYNPSNININNVNIIRGTNKGHGGVEIKDGTDIHFNNLYVKGFSSGIEIPTATAFTNINGVYITNSTFDTNSYGVRIWRDSGTKDVDNVQVTNSRFLSNVNYAISIEPGVTAGWDNFKFYDNEFYNNGAVYQILGAAGVTNFRIARNVGYVTENSGTATVANGTTSIPVLHGLATTPTRVFLSNTLWSNSGKAWVTSSNATYFTINVDVNPGVGTAIFDWRAIIGEGN